MIATGETHSVRDFCEAAFAHAGLDCADHVVFDPGQLRPAEVDLLVGDLRSGRAELGGNRRSIFTSWCGSWSTLTWNAPAPSGRSRRRPRRSSSPGNARCASPSSPAFPGKMAGIWPACCWRTGRRSGARRATAALPPIFPTSGQSRFPTSATARRSNGRSPASSRTSCITSPPCRASTPPGRTRRSRRSQRHRHGAPARRGTARFTPDTDLCRVVRARRSARRTVAAK